jgi:hypothetical protein
MVLLCGRSFSGTIWWDAAPASGRYFWKVLPVPGEPFGLRSMPPHEHSAL